MKKTLGPNFSDDLKEAGLLGLPFSWTDDGTLVFGDEITDKQKAAIQKVYDQHVAAEEPKPTLSVDDCLVIVNKLLNPDLKDLDTLREDEDVIAIVKKLDVSLQPVDVEVKPIITNGPVTEVNAGK